MFHFVQNNFTAKIGFYQKNLWSEDPETALLPVTTILSEILFKLNIGCYHQYV